MSSVRIFLASFSRSLENSGQNVLLERVVVVCNGMEGTYIPNLHMWHSPYLCKKLSKGQDQGLMLKVKQVWILVVDSGREAEYQNRAIEEL
nr:hypothetical protein CFP56_08246 [Quercus suber]